MDQLDRLLSTVGELLVSSKAAKIGEIGALFAVAWVVLRLGAPFAGENPLAKQGVVWIANILMLATVWLGLRLRGEGWAHLGLRRGVIHRRALWGAVWRSLVVCAAAIASAAIGSIVGANLVGIPEQADLSGYNYLSGNLPMLILALLGVYVVSSFGEEVIYRGFLITRIAELADGGKTALRVAIIVSSVIFGLIHYEWGAMGMLQTGLMGLALAISYLMVRRNLWVLVLAHAYLDTVLLVQLYFAPQ